jgi:hypothetical protein
MSDRMALKAALDLVHVPTQVRLLRSDPLPDGVPMLLRIAAGEIEAEHAAAALMDRSPDVVRRAAAFFIEQILFAPNADSYRVLGATPQASAGELRRNVALLLRWLHPDRGPGEERSVFVGRVTAAWNDLKTPERRAAYDAALRHRHKTKKVSAQNGITSSSRKRKGKLVSAFAHQGGGRATRLPPNSVGLLHRALAALFRFTER